MALWWSKLWYNYILYVTCVIVILVFVSMRQQDGYKRYLSHHRHFGDLPSLDHITAKFAYTTFLSHGPRDDEEDINDDNYFVATRMLAYQLLHAPETKSAHGNPFIVLVNEHVSAAKRERLAKDGAIVWEPKPVDGKWIHNPEILTWEYVMTKLRIWELTQFERVCFMDADTVLAKSLDGVFLDPAANVHHNLNIKSRDAAEPDTYVLSGLHEMKGLEHHFPPEEGEYHGHYMNAGFFVLRPSLDILRLYLSYTETPGIFPPEMPEQNLLNHAHAPDGNMPWKALNATWNIHFPTIEDWRGGVASMHAKWWESTEPEFHSIFESWRWRMEGFYEGR